MAYRVRWLIVSDGLSCPMAYRVRWLTVSDGLPCPVAYRAGYALNIAGKYGFGSVGYNMIIAATTIQWSMVITAWLAQAADGTSGKIKLGVKNLITADFNAGAVLITFGAVLGKTSRLQLILIAVIETVIYAVNEMVLMHYLKVTDVGGSMVIHMFGAYFGLAVAFALKRDDLEDEASAKEGSTVTSDLFSMVGTIFLWLYWPSFNGAMLGPGNQQSRAFVNTYISLASCCVATFVVSPLVNEKQKLNMVHIQNATLAGGVAVGAAANLNLQPWGAMLVGIIAGLLSTLGFQYITPFLHDKIKLHDTCGVHNLHGLPAIFAGIVASVASAVADLDDYGTDLYSIWPARIPKVGTAEFSKVNMTSYRSALTLDGKGRSKSEQGGYQFLAVVVTLGLAIVGGYITGFIVSLLDTPKARQVFDDEAFWDVPTDDAGIQLVKHTASFNGNQIELAITNGDEEAPTNA
eukprot:gene4945-21287_t